ncbi:MAG: hypothetical protein ACR2O0_02405 [Rhizobiaceae bacterium]
MHIGVAPTSLLLTSIILMKALFVLRHHNDFDSMTPVIDGWVRLSGDHKALVYISSPELKWRGDYRAKMLEESGPVTFVDLWAVAGYGEGGVIAYQWQRNKPDMRLSRKLLQVATEFLVAPGFSTKMTGLLDEFSPDIIAFDFYGVPNRRHFLGFFGYQEILAWRNLHNRPLVSLPHGLLLYSFDKKGKKLWTNYDAIFVESERKKSLFDDDEAPRVISSGSPRYDPLWVERISNRLDPDAAEAPLKDNKINIVFFATKKANYFKFPLLLSWLAHLAEHPDVKLVVQPHPRGQKLKDFASITNLPNVHIDARTPASTLIGNADIVSTLVSSVVVEAVVREKEILFPKFVTKAETQFDEVGACIALSKMEDTLPAIENFREGKRVPRERYEEFLRHFVYGDNDPHTIKRICAKMQEMAISRD